MTDVNVRNRINVYLNGKTHHNMTDLECAEDAMLREADKVYQQRLWEIRREIREAKNNFWKQFYENGYNK